MRNQNTPILREGWPFIAISTLILLIFIVFRLPLWLTLPWLALTVWIVAFFRNPDRPIAMGDEAIICPADGVVVAVEEIDDPTYGMGRCKRVCIFMSPFNVHVNRVPVTGTVKKIRYRPGRYYVASDEKASEHNEQCAMVLETPGGKHVAAVQIAGMLARRIVTYPREGENLVKGQRYGLIRFGSRVDLYLPLEAEIDVVKGDRVFGASSAIGRLPDGGNER
ncbi:MAG TPA: phosphatidylserine decarboxylase family protein [bacterium]|nr:phosphatidylserine decarboxylase family protein [bacterium]